MQNVGGDWRPPYVQQPQPVASTSQPAYQAAAQNVRPVQYGAISNMRPSMGFTPVQLSVLRSQILAFRNIKSGEKVPGEVMVGIKPPPLQITRQPQPYVHRSTMPATAGVSHRPVLAGTTPALVQRPQLPVYQNPALLRPYQTGKPISALPGGQPVVRPSGGQLQAVAAQQQQRAEPRKPAVPPASSYLQLPTPVPADQLKGPLYALTSGQRPSTSASMTLEGILGAPKPQAQSLSVSVAELLRQERTKLVERRMKAKMEEVERLLASGNTCPGFIKVGDKLPRGSALLELRKLRAVGKQAALRVQVEKEQADIMNMQERLYRKFVRNCQASRPNFDRVERSKLELVLERVRGVKALRSWMSEAAARERDQRHIRNRGTLRSHERWSRQHSKAKDDDRTRRMDALRANDLEAYQELLREQGAAETQGERYEVITKFLNDTEQYLHKLAGKVSNVKLQQEASEAYAKATAEARAMGFTEEEVLAAATQAAKEAAASSELITQSQVDQGDAQSRYYSLAHSVEEVVKTQPAMLQGPFNAKLREYQLVGLQWMVSLYNNRLNGILADEMGLGKTVQVMALMAYLMEYKNVFGPHLIIVPNAVMVNWKAELTQWLPDVRCVYYVGSKDERQRMYLAEVQSLQFNVLVTTYEYIMRDRAKLSKVEWKYLIIDEAQRMKDRDSKLAKDLDRFSAQRRLLLTGTPLQNELRELWSLLNLLLPEVFDDKGTFTVWFGDSLGKGTDTSKQEDEWLETEKRVVVIHRLHQILEPFMLRRQVEDVESKLPPKVSYTIKVAMPPYQATIYNWIKATGTIRTDPNSVPLGKLFRRQNNLNNKCMELRKVCNHPALAYRPEFIMDGVDLVRQSAKFAVLDRMLVKLHSTGHRVLLFSTMTRLLDLLEHYLRWRSVGPQGKHMGYLRIDGSTSLEEREKAIKRFNKPDSDAFIFLLSIRAAGRGLNLQSADTVIIYDPDPNPKNEEQAIARSHRIGQTKEVRVFHLEAVADAPSEGETTRPGPSQRKYADSIESLVRNKIQKTKIDMANEVIDAGRFDMSTTQEERKETLEALLQDEERLKKAVNKVPTAAEMNRMLARSPQEVDMFDKMDARTDWPTIPSDLDSVPEWLLYTEEEMAEVMATNSKSRQNANAEAAAAAARHKPAETKRRKRAVPGQYAEFNDTEGSYEHADDDFLERQPSPDRATRDGSISRSIEPSFLLDNNDMEEEIDGNIQMGSKVEDSNTVSTSGLKQEGGSHPQHPNTGAAHPSSFSAGGPSCEPPSAGLAQPEGGPSRSASRSGRASGWNGFSGATREPDGEDLGEHQMKKKRRKERDVGRKLSGATQANGSAAGASLGFVKEEATSSPADLHPQKKLKLTIKLKRPSD